MVAAVRHLSVATEDGPYQPRAHGARCDICPLKGNPIVPPEKSFLPTKVIFVGEAPGRKEELEHRPFRGMTGQFLRSLARELDIDVRSAHLTNSALCRSNIDKENEEASVCCAPRLLRELADLPADVPIVALGKSAALSVLGTRSIMHARGFVWTTREIDPANALKEARKAEERKAPKARQMRLKAQIAVGRSKIANRTVFPTVHPAFVLRSDTWHPILKLDLERVARWLRGDLRPEHLLDNQSYTVVSPRKHLKEAFARVSGHKARLVTMTERSIKRELAKLGDIIAVDIETAPSTPGGKDGANPLRNKIICIGISDGDHTVVLWPWHKGLARHINALFKRVRKIGMHNGYNFDQISLARHGVPFDTVEDKLEDTLIAHHTFASHMPQRLAHVASVFVDVGPWKITFKRGGGEEKGLPPEKLSGEELCRYNAADARIQARVWLEMQEDLESELHVYEVDKDNARLCRGMGVAGIGVDLARRKVLREAVVAKERALEEEMRALLKRPNFHPMQLNEVRRALFTTLRAPLAAADPTDSGLPSTSSKTLERLKGSPTRAGKFADKLLQWRGAIKIRSTYIDSQVLDKAPRKHPTIARTHFNWRSYGAASGRYSCRLQSCPRQENLKALELGGHALLPDGTGATPLERVGEGNVRILVEGIGEERVVEAKALRPVVLETRVREMYCARPGHKLLYFDCSQAELRLAAYLSGDKVYIEMCESGDVHTAIAQVLFPEEAELIRTDPKGAGKPFRDVEKNSIFGFQYYADPTTIFQFVQAKGFSIVRMSDVLNMRDLVRERCKDYFRWVEQNKKFVDKYGYYRCPISGRISWLGWHAGYPDVANRPIQKGIASIMNVRVPRILRASPRGVRAVAQIHDAAIFEVPDRHVDRMAGPYVEKDGKKKRVGGVLDEVWSEPIIIPANGYGSSTRIEDGARSFIMPIDKKVGERWSDFG